MFKRLYLLLSGLVILGFVVVHLQHFRFHPALDALDDSNNNNNNNNKYALAGNGDGGNNGGVDFYALLQDTFAEGGNAVVAGYLVGVVVLGVHLYLGWTKAVYKMDLDAQHGAYAAIDCYHHACPLSFFFFCVADREMNRAVLLERTGVHAYILAVKTLAIRAQTLATQAPPSSCTQCASWATRWRLRSRRASSRPCWPRALPLPLPPNEF